MRYRLFILSFIIFALRCLGDDVPVHPPLLTRLVNRLADELLHHMGLARFQRYRLALEESLAHLQGSQVGAMVFSRLLSASQDTDAHPRARALVSLVQLNSRSAALLTRLTDALLHDRDDFIRRTVIKCLPQLELTSHELLALLNDLLQDDDLWVRCEAARALWQLHQWHLARTIVKTVIDAHLEYYKDAWKESDPNADFSFFIKEMWDSLNLATPEATTALLTLLSNTDANVRQQAAKLLGRVDTEGVSADVIVALQRALKDKDFKVCTLAAASLVYLGHESAMVIDTLLDGLTDDESMVQFVAIEALGQLRQVPDDAVTTLLIVLQERYNLLTDDGIGDIFVEAVFLALGAAGRATPEVITVLTEALHDDHPLFCQAAVLSLERLVPASSKVVDALLALLHNKDSSIRYYAAQCLGALEPEEVPHEVVVALLQALHDTESAVQYQVAESLGQLDQLSPAIVANLLAALPINEDGWSRAHLFSLLGPFGLNDQSIKELFLQKLSEELIPSTYAQKRSLKSEIRSWCRLGRNSPYTVGPIVNTFLQVIEDSEFYHGSDDVYEGLWLLVVSSENADAEDEGRERLV